MRMASRTLARMAKKASALTIQVVPKRRLKLTRLRVSSNRKAGPSTKKGGEVVGGDEGGAQVEEGPVVGGRARLRKACVRRPVAGVPGRRTTLQVDDGRAGGQRGRDTGVRSYQRRRTERVLEHAAELLDEPRFAAGAAEHEEAARLQ